jgi:hypothetical protein
MFRRGQKVCVMDNVYYGDGGARFVEATDVVWDDGQWQLI